ncbi:hypothetical protein WDW37_00295 [Bdellovibrionota bacterium FG-1]
MNCELEIQELKQALLMDRNLGVPDSQCLAKIVQWLSDFASNKEEFLLTASAQLDDYFEKRSSLSDPVLFSKVFGIPWSDEIQCILTAESKRRYPTRIQIQMAASRFIFCLRKTGVLLDFAADKIGSKIESAISQVLSSEDISEPDDEMVQNVLRRITASYFDCDPRMSSALRCNMSKILGTFCDSENHEFDPKIDKQDIESKAETVLILARKFN